MDFPSNSRAAREPEEKKLAKVVTGEVRTRKKPLGRKFLEAFVGGSDAGSIWQYVLFEVILPAAKDTIADAVSQSVERMLFGEARSSSRRTGTRPSGTGGFVSYNRFASPSTTREETRIGSRRGAHNFDDIVLDTRAEALEVIERMFDVVAKYQVVTVADLYELVGLSPSPIDHKWGWSDLRGAGPTRVTNGYLLDLPKPDPIN
jgi:hypothetical protein